MKNQNDAGIPAKHTYALDAELASSITQFLDSHPPVDKAPKGDWIKLRQMGDQLYGYMNEHLPLNAHVQRQDFEMKSASEALIPLRWYSSGPTDTKTAAVVFVHGGGRLFGSINGYDRIVADYVHRSKVPFLSIEYGLAPDTYGPTQVEQVFDAILWLKENASQLGVDVEKIAVMGDSGGGGLAAGAAILARDRNISLAKQILIYPMLDHRTTVLDENLEPFAVFGHQELDTVWQAILGPHTLSEYDLMITSPAMLDNFEGLAPAYIAIGDLDYFRNENLAYASRLAGAAVPLEFHIVPGATHGFEIFNPDTSIAQRAIANHVQAIQSI